MTMNIILSGKWTFFLILLITLGGCSFSNKQRPVGCADTCFLSLSTIELNAIKNFTIVRRGDRPIAIVQFEVDTLVFVLPTKESGYADSVRITRPNFHMMRFAKWRGKSFDTSQAITYVDSLVNEALSVFRKSKVVSVNARPLHGDFSIFEPLDGYEYVYRYSKYLDDDIWKTFFDTAEMVKQNWYRGSPVDKRRRER